MACCLQWRSPAVSPLLLSGSRQAIAVVTVCTDDFYPGYAHTFTEIAKERDFVPVTVPCAGQLKFGVTAAIVFLFVFVLILVNRKELTDTVVILRHRLVYQLVVRQ